VEGLNRTPGLESPGIIGPGRVNTIVPQEVRELFKEATEDPVAGKVEF